MVAVVAVYSLIQLSLVWSYPLLHIKRGVAQTGLEDALLE